VKGLYHFELPAGRGKSYQLSFGGRAVTLIDDSYNASPVSMRAAFDLLLDLKQVAKGGVRTVAVVGDMLELGAASEGYHASLAEDIAACDIDVVYCVGDAMRSLYALLPADCQGGSFAVSEEVMPVLQKELQAGDIILVKGSNGIKMNDVVRSLRMASQ